MMLEGLHGSARILLNMKQLQLQTVLWDFAEY